MRCPHPSCKKEFDKFEMHIDDFNKLIRETYYACPHCKSRVNVVITGEDAFEFSPDGKDIPPSTSVCPYYFGYLSLFCKESPVPEECLACTRITKCITKNL